MANLSNLEKYTPVTQELLNSKVSRVYEPQKWILFCATLLPYVDSIKLYEAQTTVSKYILIQKGKATYKVRFSNHKPNRTKEKQNDCDFFVGVSNSKITTTQDALAACVKRLKLPNLTLLINL